MSNILASFPTIDEELLNKINVEMIFDKISYDFGSQKNELNIIQNNENEYYIEDSNEIWNPCDNNIIFNMQFKLFNKNIFFDERIINENATLGLAFVWMSKNSNQTKTIPIIDFKKDNEEMITANIIEGIPAGMLRSKIDFKIVVYVKYIEEQYNDFNQEIGTILGDIWYSSVNLEGDGSTFPIEIIQDKNQLLWKAKFNFSDIYEDSFDKEFICLQINKAHKDFASLNVEGDELSPMMKEIIAEFIYLLMCELKDMQIDLNSLADYQVDNEENNIANIIKIWIYLFKIDFSSNYNMMQSIKKGVNDKF